MSLRRRVASWLEQGALPSSLTLAPSALYGRIAAQRLARPVLLPPHVNVIGVGGAVLGGAGKTPVAIAYAKALKQKGQSVVVVSHGYKAAVDCARQVGSHDDVRQVGDDALLAARELEDVGVAVWVGSSRQEALSAAASKAMTIVVDGLLQASPCPVTRSLLVLDELEPWGSGRCLPAGDLRAPPSALLAACDQVVLLRDPALANRGVTTTWPGAMRAELQLLGFSLPSGKIDVREADAARLGVLLLVGRPQRVLASLRARGVRPLCHWFGADHTPPSSLDCWILRRMARQHRLDGWLVTPKCRTHLSSDLGAPLWTIETFVHLDPGP